MIVGCDEEFCFYPLIYNTNQCCLYCGKCIRQEEIKKELQI